MAVVLFGFYFSTSEWCHCQPDTWMLLPALLAMFLRQQQAAILCNPGVSTPGLIGRAIMEGLLWGAAFSLKPFVLFPALACWLLTIAQTWRAGASARRMLALDMAGVMLGGSLVGGGILIWIRVSENWPFFMEGAMGAWNQDYYGSSPLWHSRLIKMMCFFWPWSLLHLVAVPMAVAAIGRAVVRPRVKVLELARSRNNLRPLLATLYLGWLLQANFIQRQLIYQTVPPMLLAITLVFSPRTWRQFVILAVRHQFLRNLVAAYLLALAAAWFGIYGAWHEGADFLVTDVWLDQYISVHPARWLGTAAFLAALAALFVGTRALRWVRRLASVAPACWLARAALLMGIIALCPLLQFSRLLVWDLCWRLGSTPPLRNVLTLESDMVAPDWVALEEVKHFLASRHVKDRELTCYGTSAVHLYKEMDLKPSTRFVLLWPALLFFPHHRNQIAQELKSSPERYIVNDLKQRAHGGRYPMAFPVVFQKGRYRVHQAKPDSGLAPLSMQAGPPAQGAALSK
jgi:hypothetical protein